MKPNALALVEPMLFKIPLIRHFLLSFGCVRPATKREMFKHMAQKTPLGLLPGGSEEIILSKHGRERVYIKVGRCGDRVCGRTDGGRQQQEPSFLILSVFWTD